MRQKILLLTSEIKERGLFFGLKRIMVFLFRPIAWFAKSNILLIEASHGTLAKIKLFLPFYSSRFGLVRFNQSDLVKEVRNFWYSNVPGEFDLRGERISRRDIFVYGGPNPEFTCSICQESEWLSRIRQKNRFIPHTCPQGKKCEELCKKQGDEMWTHLHQNFDFSIGCDNNLPAPKMIYCVSPRGKEHFLNPGCDIFPLLLRRRLAYSCQIDITTNPLTVDWSKYDLAMVASMRDIIKFPKPPLPTILYGHDFWGEDSKVFQWVINWLNPEIFLTLYPAAWKKYFKMPETTKVIFLPFFDSLFFSRPNLGRKDKDLLVIGAKTSSIYEGRASLDKEISRLSDKYRIEFSHSAGAGNVFRNGPVLRKDARTSKPIRFLNKWSEYLGSSKYVIFGRMKYPILVSKYYEVLGSGAVPIFPEVEDLNLLGIKPFEHYIPLSEVEGNKGKMEYYLDNYEKFKRIANNAVNWYRDNSDRMIFEDFEEEIIKMVGSRFGRRLVYE
jgi:hypothetical protein